MYVCLCKNVTDSDIEAAVANGCGNMRELKSALGVGSQCGRCTSHAREVLYEAKQTAHSGPVQYATPLQTSHLQTSLNMESCYT
ncbi:(2Fe-2S)-binding protein [Aliidiomarina taiwanensis]|uniref:Bacterioferritin-associated ferredoxin n=1 Tax=Aliidiomarina taiwanensis TaxID=946228 RepID=A0A432X057_9GAMM|nr:bacterioferritin-associated ferredoxin [Aliidiomarina taiwanensis]RUO39386.1 (2Fe-2S)-binding protein [Aliidiomarina taiwanensis]